MLIATSLLRGASRPNRADTSLLAGKRIVFGHKVSHSEHKTIRTWKPNVVHQSLYSRVLDTHLRLKVSTSALRTIDKLGGLDPYLLITPHEKLDSKLGSDLKAKITRLLNVKTKSGKVPLPTVSSPFVRFQPMSGPAVLNNLPQKPVTFSASLKSVAPISQ